MRTIERLITLLDNHQMSETIGIADWQGRKAIYEAPGQYRYIDEDSRRINVGDRLAESGETLFLRQTVELPEHWGDAPAGFVFHAGAGVPTLREAMVRLDGVPYHGLDRNRSYVPFPANRGGKRRFELEIELFNPAAQPLDTLNRQNEPAEYDPAPLVLLQSELVLPNTAAQSLLHTVKTYYEAASLLADGDLNKSRIAEALEEAALAIRSAGASALQDAGRVQAIEEGIRSALSQLGGQVEATMHMVGQSHIDIAWLWPVKETVRKCSRTFSTMSTLLDEYPDFTYAQSQPQAYDFVKKWYPELYERVKRHIAEGRWEVVGGMWVEPDLNIPSGESFVRQLIYGMKFYREEFGERPRIEWLPDTFGYCASLPQLLRKAGIDYFMTTKMNWNDTNPFPYDLFHWVGIDGTEVLAYLNHGLNEPTHPKEVKIHWDSYKQKATHPEHMLLYGHGDGGGGVTREMIEYVARSAELPGLPRQRFSTAHAFFDGIRDAAPELPSWHGDMYLELHRGTYTTHARNKRWNRKAEALYRDAEIWSAFAATRRGEGLAVAAAPALEEGWKLLLLNQFHDIIPGSSIPEVYVTSEEEYRTVFAIGEETKREALASLTKEIDTRGEGVPVVLFNSLSWDRSETVRLPGNPEWGAVRAYDENGQTLPSDVHVSGGGEVEVAVYAADIPAMGYRTIWLRPENGTAAGGQAQQGQADASAQGRLDASVDTAGVGAPAADIPFDGRWETDYYAVEWNEHGEISRLFDKKADREVLRAGETANQLQLFHDMPLEWDAWDVDPRFAQQPADRPELLGVDVAERGVTRDVLRFRWKLSASSIEQDIVFPHHSPRIDFVTKVDWREKHKLLKAAFPVEVLSGKASYEIPFGTVERATHANTSWERAQFEVCGHRWADLSEGGYGVALLNDCKYGYDVKGRTLRLSLLRAPTWPDPGADQGAHEFTYSLVPHEGDWRAAGIVRHGYELNSPVTACIADSHEGALPSRHSFIQVEGKHAVLDTVKPAEDGSGLVLRLYESGGGRERIVVRTGDLPIRSAKETNLLEEHPEALPTDGQTLRAEMAPYEVKTIILD